MRLRLPLSLAGLTALTAIGGSLPPLRPPHLSWLPHIPPRSEKAQVRLCVNVTTCRRVCQFVGVLYVYKPIVAWRGLQRGVLTVPHALATRSRKHNTHHVFTNHIGVDPDIDMMPAIFLWAPSKALDHHFRKWQHFYALPLYSLIYATWRFNVSFSQLLPLQPPLHCVLLDRAFDIVCL